MKMNENEKIVDELIKRYSHRMPFPEKARALVSLYLKRATLPQNEWDLLVLSLLASFSEPLFLHLYGKGEILRDFFDLTRNKDNLNLECMKSSLQKKIFSTAEKTEEVLNDFRIVNLSAIAVLDLLSIMNFEEVTAAISDLADAIVSTTVYLVEHKTLDKMGMPYHKGKSEKLVKTKFIFFALGKWGARELNYSSDIDIITFYEEDGRTDKNFSNAEYFEKIARSVYEILTSECFSLKGFKVDFNLRPRGKDGNLTLPLKNAFEYYKREAHFWEKQAWIKARPFYGDFQLGEEFIGKIHKIILNNEKIPFICDEIKKTRIKTLSTLPEKEKNLKEGEGSIRDIEFATQALSIATSKSRIEASTLKSLHFLKEQNYLTLKEEEEIKRSYEILRKVEHFVQVTNLRQTHLEPDSDREWDALKKFLSRENSRKLIEDCRRKAKDFFSKKIEFLLKREEKQFSKEEIEKDLKRLGIEQVEILSPSLSRIYNYLLSSNVFTMDKVREIHKIILSLKNKSLCKTVKSFEAIISNEESFNLLLSKPEIFQKVFERILKIVSLSESVSEYLKTVPETILPLIEEEIPEINISKFRFKIKKAELREISLEQKKIFVQAISRKILLKENNFTEIYTGIAEAILKELFEKTVKEFDNYSDLSSQLAVFALGRLGFREMVFGSDLDLLIVKKDEKSLPNLFSESTEIKAVRKFIESLSSLTYSGALYVVDLRLRPYGNSGVLVPSIEGVKNYFQKEARLWEKLSFTKLRFICGNKNLSDKVYSAVSQSFAPLNISSLSSVVELIRRLLKNNPNLEGEIKFGRGCLFDQDLFLASLLNNSGKYKPGGDFNYALEFLGKEKILSGNEISLLREARNFFLRLLDNLRIYSSLHKKSVNIEEIKENSLDRKEDEKLRKEIVLLINSHFPNLL